MTDASLKRSPRSRNQRIPKGVRALVNVTQELIDHAKTRDSSHCMIAMAIKDAVPNATSVAVDLQTLRFSIPEKRLRMTYLTPRIAQICLVNWDDGKKPEPFSFYLRGAHVTAMRNRNVEKTPASRSMTAAKAAALAKADSVNPGRGSGPRAKIVGQGNGNGQAARRVGGLPPPSTPFSRRREFGLRALQR